MEHIGKYIVIKELIVTGFSNLYLCQDPDLEVRVAVKVFDIKGDNVGEKAQYGTDIWLARFVQEAKLLARLDHPHIVPVRELSVDAEGRPFFVMPFVEANLIYEIGRDVFDAKEQAALEERWRPRRIGVGRSVELLRQVLSALQLMHRRGMVHRDVKPGNVLLTRKHGGDAKLCDFGMVKLPDFSLSRSGIWIGTLDYIAPEQRRSAREVDARADVYSAAAMGYRMLTGTLPAGRFPAPREMAPEVPAALSELIMRCLARDPDQRPANAGRMLQELTACLVPWHKGTAPQLAHVQHGRTVKAKLTLAPVLKAKKKPKAATAQPPKPTPEPATEPATEPAAEPDPNPKPHPAKRIRVHHKPPASPPADARPRVSLTLTPQIKAGAKPPARPSAEPDSPTGQARIVAVTRRPAE